MKQFRLVTALLIAVSAVAMAQPVKVSKYLTRVDPKSTVDVIVQYKQPPTLAHHKKVFALGGTLKRELPLINAASYSLPAVSLQALAANPEVKFISPNRKVHMLLDHSSAAVNAPYAWSLGLDGSGVGVAVIDSGISNHDDLVTASGRSRIIFRDSFVDGQTDDFYGHGEHVAGIVAGNGTDSPGVNVHPASYRNCTECKSDRSASS